MKYCIFCVQSFSSVFEQMVVCCVASLGDLFVFVLLNIRWNGFLNNFNGSVKLTAVGSCWKW